MDPKTYIRVAFLQMKLFWFFVLVAATGAVTMRYYFKDDSAAIALLVIAIFMIGWGLISAYIDIKRRNL